MRSTLAQRIDAAIKKRIPSGKDIAPLLRDSKRLIPYTCRYLIHSDSKVRFVAADALLRISRNHRSIIAKHIENILRGLKFQDAKTRTKILLTISPVVHEYPTRIERYLATISYCLYNQDNSALRFAASSCLGNLAALDDRRASLYIPMMLQCINKYKREKDTWKVIPSLSPTLRSGTARRQRKRIREVVLPFRNRGSSTQRSRIRRILKLTTI